MKIAVAILVIALALLGIFFVNTQQSSKQQLELAAKQISMVSNEVVNVRGELDVARAEASQVRTQMQAQVDQLQQTVSKLDADKAEMQAKLQTLSTELAATKQALQEEQAKVVAAQQTNEKLTTQIQEVSNQLGAVEKRLGDLQQVHATTVEHLTAMRAEYTALVKEKASLDAKLHDLKALKDQIVTVKQEIHEQKVAEWKRQDRIESAQGNGGFLMKQGQWVAPAQTGKFPLTEDIRREQ